MKSQNRPASPVRARVAVPITILRNRATEQIFRSLPDGYNIRFASRDDAAGAERLRETEILIAALAAVDRDLVAAMPRLRLVQSFGVGTDLFDLDALRERGILVANTRGYNADVVAEHAMMLTLVLSRSFVQPYLDLKQRGEWRGSGNRSWELQSKSLGILGFGRVGRALARKARAFDMRVAAWNRRPGTPRSPQDGVVFLALEGLLAQTDVLCITAPLTDETRGLIGARELARLKPGAVLINVGRGPIVDQDALIAAVQAGDLRGAGLDVTDPEPLPARHPLLQVDNIVVTPHCAGSSTDTRARGRRVVYENIDRYLRGQVLEHLVLDDDGT